ncbi:RNA polymerase sigma factor [Marinicella meishanensis]|uniref:RNA polymerase sigma factor n=1 Tax=Marinicella meishanensis TaxID=2873263 RepID=UPI001CBF5D44|nr:sigma-70 family RNA polymerase sigma factor [Marinicella sp. NBU2979]
MHPLSTTMRLIDGFKAGHSTASNGLMDMFGPILLKWAHGRVPHHARNHLETRDLVQDTLALAFKNHDQLKADNPGAFFCYLRQIFLNQVKQELRKNKLFQVALTTQFTHDERMAYEEDLHAMMAYDAAIDQLSEAEKHVVIMRLEFGMSHQEIAELTDRKSPDAARVYFKRAVNKLAKIMAKDHED